MRELSTILVGHRGFPTHYPENTLASLRAAMTAGARWIEFDVQLSADAVPHLLHDADLRRTAARPEKITELPSSRLGELRAAYGRRFGTRFQDEPLPTLAMAATLLAQWPQVTAFVEIKQQSIHPFGVERCMAVVSEALAPVRSQCVIISFHAGVLRQARAGGWPIGWVFESWSHRNERIARRLAPEYLFSALAKIPEGEAPLWPGPWRWALYESSDLEEIHHALARGADLVETNAIGTLLPPPA